MSSGTQSITPAKITRPETRNVIARPRLVSLLARPASKPIVWLTLLAGSGKTSLVAGYIQEKQVGLSIFTRRYLAELYKGLLTRREVDIGSGDNGIRFFLPGHSRPGPGRNGGVPPPHPLAQVPVGGNEQTGPLSTSG